MHIAIINGPNINMIGTREPDVYGSVTFDEHLEKMHKAFPTHRISHFQSNIEGELIDQIQKMGDESDGIVLNGASFTHTSIGMGDAVSAINKPVIEVHISNIYAREEYRHHSFLTGKCVGVISGLGLKGYDLAIEYFVNQNREVKG